LDIINVHLTAYDATGQLRLNELQQINTHIPDNVFTLILGDFNMINPKEYTSDLYLRYISAITAKFGLTSVEYDYITKKHSGSIYIENVILTKCLSIIVIGVGFELIIFS